MQVLDDEIAGVPENRYTRAMLGHREKLNARETDALSRRSRNLLWWKPGALRKIKRAVSKRVRVSGKAAVRELPE